MHRITNIQIRESLSYAERICNLGKPDKSKKPKSVYFKYLWDKNFSYLCMMSPWAPRNGNATDSYFTRKHPNLNHDRE